MSQFPSGASSRQIGGWRTVEVGKRWPTNRVLGTILVGRWSYQWVADSHQVRPPCPEPSVHLVQIISGPSAYSASPRRSGAKAILNRRLQGVRKSRA
jgi:hypothetical protein